MKFRELFSHFREMKHFFIATLMVFGIGIFVGWEYAGQYTDYLQGGIEKLKRINEYVSNKENPQLWLFVIIFLNNTFIAILFIYLGLIFGILPMFMLVSNGMVLGFVLSQLGSGSTWSVLIKGILPHGIFELTAILLAFAYGLKLGSLVFQLFIHFFIPKVGASARAELSRVLRLTLPLVGFIVILLLIAAIVESTVSYWLMGG
jgi:stage II sporulation protein M